MKENKGEQPEQEIKSILKKYEKYVSNIEWHIRVNKPPEEEIKKLNAQIEYYNEMISDLHGIPAQPSKVQEKEIEEKEWKIVLNFFQGEYTLNPRTTIEEVIRELMQTYTLIKK